MKTIFKIISAAIVFSCFTSCTFVKINGDAFSGMNHKHVVVGNEQLKTVSYNVPEFVKLDVNISADVVYEMTENEPYVQIYTSENLMDYMHFEVVDGCLNVKMDDGVRAKCKKMEITVKSKTLTDVVIRGAGDFDIPFGLDCERFSATIQGAGDFNINTLRSLDEVHLLIQGAGDADIDNVECTVLKAEIQGAGDIDLSGACDAADLKVQGAGDIDIRNLKAGNISSVVQGAGDIIR